MSCSPGRGPNPALLPSVGAPAPRRAVTRADAVGGALASSLLPERGDAPIDAASQV